jgi:GTP-binding protein
MNIRSADFLTSVGFLSQLPTDGRTEIAFSGRSNVGKSSLLNRLLNRKKLVKTSRTPGKTRTLNFFTVNEAFYMVDLPGYGYAKRSMSEREQWGQLIESYVLDRPVLKGYVHDRMAAQIRKAVRHCCDESRQAFEPKITGEHDPHKAGVKLAG